MTMDDPASYDEPADSLPDAPSDSPSDALPDSLADLTRELIAIRRRPTTQQRYKSYPQLLARFAALVDGCDDVAQLRQVIALDSGYFLLAGYRQAVLQRWLMMDRSSEVLRLYAHQLLLFGDVDAFGEAETDVTDRVEALLREADEQDSDTGESP